jgi:hypothetical protein
MDLNNTESFITTKYLTWPRLPPHQIILSSRSGKSYSIGEFEGYWENVKVLFSMIKVYVDYIIPTKNGAYVLNRALQNSIATLK